jgi:uncharacterized protein (DUF1800 family)
MSLSTQIKNRHLLWRAGFGPAVEQFTDIAKASPLQIYKALQKASAKKPDYFDMADDYLKGLMMGIEEIGQQEKKELPPEEKKKRQQKNREGIRNLNMRWMSEMVNSNAQLREKIAFFWHGHFACRNLNVFYQQQLIDIIRRSALGNFGDLLREVSKSAAMTNFLNNNQNRKGHPNENFAREVMELFTLGRGNYSENDVKEAARAFTGWGANVQGEFIFRKNQHDEGTKIVLNQKGNFEGDDVLDIILEQKQTAKFIAQKIYVFFVNDTVDTEKINWLADRFFNNNYDIGKLMEDIFTSDWFYDEKNIGAKIKSPVELLVGIQRILPMELENTEALGFLQKVLGQILFYPPNVAGWPGGKAWIDSSTLMLRMRIPQLITDVDELNIKAKDDDDLMMGRKDEEDEKMKIKGYGKKQMIRAEIDWTGYLKNYESIPKENLSDALKKDLLQAAGNGVSTEIVRQYTDLSGRDNFIKTATMRIMGTPEYQLC